MNSSVRLKLDFLSPLPPTRSGISDYSVDLLPDLLSRADVRVVALPDSPVDPEVRSRFSVVDWEIFERDRSRSVVAGAKRPDEEDLSKATQRLPLYQMGNNRFHEVIHREAWRRPGVLTLHDLVLHHLVAEETLGERSFERYEARMVADHGWIGRATAAPRRWGGILGAGLFELPVRQSLLRRQRGVLVHSRWAAERLLEDEPELRVRAVPMGIPLPPPADPEDGQAFRQRYDLPLEAPLLGSFGFQTPIKRTASVIRALAAPSLETAHLLVAGESSAGNDLEALAVSVGVEERVHFVGYLPFEDLEAAIAATNLCVNLRYPSAGETSASLLRILAVGRPALVSNYAQFAELPDAGVVKVDLSGDDGDPQGEIDSIVAMMKALLADPGHLAALGQAARQHIGREHSPATAAREVLEACSAWHRAEPLDPLPVDAPRAVQVPAPTSLAYSHLDGSIEVLGLEDWNPGTRSRLTLRLRNTGSARWLAAHRGPGGVAFELSLQAEGREVDGQRPWLPLPLDLEAGEETELEIELRHPPGACQLRIAGRLLGGAAAGLPTWEGCA